LRIAAEHSRHFGNAVVTQDHTDVGRRNSALGSLGYHNMMVCACRYLREVRNHEHLVVLSQPSQAVADPQGNGALIPASTSSNTSVGTWSSRARMD
jgi:hypothetical protein